MRQRVRVATGSAAVVLSVVMICLLGADAEAGGESSAPGGQPQLKQFHLSGRVLLPDGSPAAGAAVKLQFSSVGPGAREPEVDREEERDTGPDGAYDFGWLPVPRVEEEGVAVAMLSAVLEGYAVDAAFLVFQGPEEARREPYVLMVEADEVTRDLRLSEAASIRGSVVDADGKAIVGADVVPSSLRMPGPGGRRDRMPLLFGLLSARTGGDGRFEIKGVPAGATVSCTISKEGQVSATAQLAAGGEQQIALPPGGAIEGQVVYGDTGLPAPGVTVYTRIRMRPSRDIIYPTTQSATTDEEGKFRIAGMPGSSATVMARLGELAAEYTAEQAYDVPIVAGETTSGVVLRLVKGGMVKGAVADATTGQPVAGASISASRLVGTRSERYGSSTTDAQGRYSIRLPGGEYSLRCTAPAGYLRDWEMRPDEMRTVTVTEGEDVEAPAMKVEPAASVTIRVMTPAGEPAPGIWVNAVGEAASFRSAPTDASGTLKVDGQRAGVTVQFTAQNEDGALRGEGEITPKLGQDNELVITLAEARPCSVVGRVADESGKPIGGARISFNWPAGPGSWRGDPRATTDADGRFEIRALSPGDELFVSVSTQGYGRKSCDRFSLDEGQTHDVGVMTLARADKELTGRVLDRNGEPVAGLRLTAYGPQSTHQEALTGKNGTFHLRDLVDESIRLMLIGEDGNVLAHESVQAGTRDFVFRVYELGEEPEPEVAAEVGKAAPELVLEEGAAVRLAGLKGKPVILAFVSIYSRPCARLLLELKAAQEKHGADALAVVAVHDRTATPEEIEEFRKENGITFPIVRVPEAEDDGWKGETFLSYGVKALPRLALLDASVRLKTLCDGSRLSDIIQEAVAQAAKPVAAE